MADHYRYTGPEPGVDANTLFKARAECFLRSRADEIHQEQVTAWAAADTGDYPSRSDAARDALEELEVLLRGIGKWGLIDPDTLSLGHRTRRPRRPRGFDLPDWERDLLE